MVKELGCQGGGGKRCNSDGGNFFRGCKRMLEWAAKGGKIDVRMRVYLLRGGGAILISILLYRRIDGPSRIGQALVVWRLMRTS